MGRYKGPSSNYQVLGKKEFKDRLTTSLFQSLDSCGVSKEEVRCLCLGLAGVDRKEERDWVRKHIGIAEKVSINNDALVALIGAFPGEAGIILIAGTGSICLGVNEKGEVARSGGWGYLLGDEGSGYYLGREALIAALKDLDGRGQKTLLRKEIESRFRLKRIDHIIPMVYRGELNREGIARLAPLVLETAAKGDDAARMIVAEAGRQLGRMVTAVTQRLGLKKPRVALSGGLFCKGEMLVEEIKGNIGKEVEIVSPRFQPVIGAVILALQEIGIPPDEEILKNLEQTSDDR